MLNADPNYESPRDPEKEWRITARTLQLEGRYGEWARFVERGCGAALVKSGADYGRWIGRSPYDAETYCGTLWLRTENVAILNTADGPRVVSAESLRRSALG